MREAIGAFVVVVAEGAGFDVVFVAAEVVALAGALVDFFRAAVAVGFAVEAEADPVAFDAAGGAGFTEPDPNVPELMI